MLKTGPSQLKRPPPLARRGVLPGWLAPFALMVAVTCVEFEPASDVRLAPSPPGDLDGESGAMQTVVQNEQPSGPSGPDWSCLRPVAQSGMLVTNPAQASRLVQSLQVLSLTTGELLPGISVRACAQRDVACNEPLTPTMIPDADGWVDLPLYEGFDGYLEITGDITVPTTLFYADPLLPGTSVDKTPLGLVEKSVLPSLSAATGTVQEDDSGLVYLRAFDCLAAPAPGIEFSIDRPGARWYFVDGLPTSLAEQTAESGLGGFINVEPGVSVVNASIVSSGAAIAPPRSVIVRGGWMTGLRWFPTAPE